MLTHVVNGDSRLALWSRVRRFAVPPSMIETATARREAGDWAGACAAANIDLDLHPRTVARCHGQDVAARLRADLRRLAPDLLRWHLPRIAPDGLLRPGLTITLARYGAEGRAGPYPVHLVVRTPPAWADAGQRIGLALWDGSAGSRSAPDARRHPHPRPSSRYRLDLHRHLWDARSAPELRARSGADQPSTDGPVVSGWRASEVVPPGYGCAVGRWADEARILLAAEGRSGGPVLVRLGARRRLLLHLDDGPDGAGSPVPRIEVASDGDGAATRLPVLPDAATWVPPDLELLRSGAIHPDRLHPLVAAALVPGHAAAGPPRAADPAGEPRIVECRGERHRIGLVDGVLAPLDHGPDEIRREELLVALTGTPLPCLKAIDQAHRRPDDLSGVRERLDHGDTAGALAVVEGLLGPGAVLHDGPLRDELEAAARRRITYGLYRAGLTGPGPDHVRPDRRRRPTRARRSRDALFH
ncbi:hypothetical protein [Streptomyces heilongjiangensis]|uniref:Uncharacterized protein n=1 Tax=Streptomyces heilongjiangensis TaxID=945052 RepID=A0ABW1B578_9ACTN|nr:hypothetical protein [Streptomyces heilongjiangensis]MDC2947835.1 hypothetical protein [Streptomyces heilongjiangensis]